MLQEKKILILEILPKIFQFSNEELNLLKIEIEALNEIKIDEILEWINLYIENQKRIERDFISKLRQIPWKADTLIEQEEAKKMNLTF